MRGNFMPHLSLFAPCVNGAMRMHNSEAALLGPICRLIHRVFNCHRQAPPSSKMIAADRFVVAIVESDSRADRDAVLTAEFHAPASASPPQVDFRGRVFDFQKMLHTQARQRAFSGYRQYEKQQA